jgi:hypothetical protein
MGVREMVRQAFLKELNDALSKSEHFEEHDFKVDWKAANVGYDLTIVYRYDEAYGINAHVGEDIEEGKREIGIWGTASPGDIGTSESFTIYGRTKFFAYVKQWLGRLRTELQAVPVNRIVEEQRKQIEELIGTFAKLPNEYFSRDEAEVLKARLDALEQQMVEVIISNAAEDEDVSSRVSNLEQDFTVLKEHVQTLKKPGWTRAFATRVAKWMRDSDNRKLLADGVEITRRLLGP